MTDVFPKEGEVVTATLVTGERAVGYYSATSPVTGSHLLQQVTVEGGLKADYAWAEKIDERFDNRLVQGIDLGPNEGERVDHETDECPAMKGLPCAVCRID